MRTGRILVVDDDPWILRMVCSSLEKQGFVIDRAKDGQAGFARAIAAPPDLIITDLMMPVLDGWSFFQQVRATPALAHVPVLFLTALGKDQEKLRALGLTERDYLAKPFRFADLEQRVAQALGHSNAEPASELGLGQSSSTQPLGTRSAMRTTQVGLPPLAQDDDYQPPREPGGASNWSSTSSISPMPDPSWGSVSTVAPTPAGFGASVQRSVSGGPPIASTSPMSPPAPASKAQSPAQEANSGLAGRLEQLGLSSLLVMMELERKGGVLALVHAEDSAAGRIFLREGQVVHARLDAEPDVGGRECVYAMLRWQRGRFSFDAMEVDMEDTIHTSTTSLLMEGARLMDEANR